MFDVDKFIEWCSTNPTEDFHESTEKYKSTVYLYDNSDDSTAVTYPPLSETYYLEYILWAGTDSYSFEFQHQFSLTNESMGMNFRDSSERYDIKWATVFKTNTPTEEEIFQYSLVYDLPYITFEQFMELFYICKKLLR